MNADFEKWRAAVAGQKPPMHEDEPWCGYYRMRDRRGLNAALAAVKRPWVACAIWRGPDGLLVAELAKSPIAVDRVWPHCARFPISHELYAFWHQHERWPEEANLK